MSNAKIKKPDKMICSICGETKVKSNYYKSTRKEYIHNNGYCPICKKCLGNMLIDIESKAITIINFKKVLSYLDLVYIPSLFIEISEKENIKTSNFIGMYKKALNLKSEWKNLKFADSVRFECELELAKNETKKEQLAQITNDMKRFWRGSYKTDEDCIYLQELFDNFTENEENMDYKKESDYKTLCVYELQKTKIQTDLDRIKDIQMLQKMIDELSSSLGIKAIQKKDGFDSNKFVLGIITRFAEDVIQNPVKRWVEDLGNVDLMKDICEVHYTGNIANVFGMSNDKILEYQKELDKYSVQFDDMEVVINGEETK